MCKHCKEYLGTGAKYCLVCGSPIHVKDKIKVASKKEEGMFKHASEDLDLNKKENQSDKVDNS